MTHSNSSMRSSVVASRANQRASSRDSVTRWLDSLKNGNDEVVARLWELYFSRLVALARKQLGNTPRAIYDEEDVALSAFKSIFSGVHHKRVSNDMDRESLWKLMATVTLRKVYDFIAYRKRKKRYPTHASTGLPVRFEHPDIIHALISQEPTPEVTAEFDETFDRMLNSLSREELRQIVVFKLEGYTNQEIAVELNRGLSTIERKLKTIREIWRNEYTK